MISNNEFEAISELDLDPIKVKLMHKESGEGWTLEYANAVESEYRRFLYLMKMFPNEQTAPLFDVDVFWHYHILDTMKYADDCESVFGYFLHHFPYVGLRGADDEAAHQRIGVRMQEMYEETFGESYRLTEQDGPATAYSAAPTGARAGAVGKTAYSAAPTGGRAGAVGKTAYSAAPTGARAGADGKTAYSAAVTGTPLGARGKPDVNMQDGSWARTATVDRFYVERPLLAA
jgi:hypothetical protein